LHVEFLHDKNDTQTMEIGFD